MLLDELISGWRNGQARLQPATGPLPREPFSTEGPPLRAAERDTRGRMATGLDTGLKSKLLKAVVSDFSGASPVERPATMPKRADSKTTPDDQTFILQLQAGDRQAFAQLLDRYEARVYRLALRFTGAAMDAEDVTQEIFLGIYKSIGNFRGGAALSTWIYRVAMNHCLEFRRKRKLDCVPYNEELALASQDWREDPEQSAGKTELSARVEAALQHLSPQHRDVIVLHELQGLTYQEVASALNVPVGTVKSRLSNAFRRLRDLLGGYVRESAE